MENVATIHVVMEVLVGNMQVHTFAPVKRDTLEDIVTWCTWLKVFIANIHIHLCIYVYNFNVKKLLYMPYI